MTCVVSVSSFFFPLGVAGPFLDRNTYDIRVQHQLVIESFIMIRIRSAITLTLLCLFSLEEVFSFTRQVKPFSIHTKLPPSVVERLQHKSGTSNKSTKSRIQLQLSHDNSRSSIKNTNKQGILRWGSLLASASFAIILAKLNIVGPYTNELIFRDIGATFLCASLSLIFIKSISVLAKKDLLQPRDSRKIIHSLSAPLFMLLWPLFSDLWGARLFAAIIPLFQGVNLLLAGTKQGGEDGDELSKAISRSGDAEEALQGPFIYVVILFFAIVLGFRDNLSPMIALSTMAAGDGMADIIGRRFGKTNKWFFSERKSIAGTLAFIIAASVSSTLLAMWFQSTGMVLTGLSLTDMIQRIVIISSLSAVVELLPIFDDNWSVPITAALLASFLL
jgi:dolichol kinase